MYALVVLGAMIWQKTYPSEELRVIVRSGAHFDRVLSARRPKAAHQDRVAIIDACVLPPSPSNAMAVSAIVCQVKCGVDVDSELRRLLAVDSAVR